MIVRPLFHRESIAASYILGYAVKSGRTGAAA